ncbi:hypothetical protein N9O24_00380 [bacterium]|nr:hypothetical protein [bacterium]
MYGSFARFLSSVGSFGISRIEETSLDPQMMLVLETSYSSLSAWSSRQLLRNMPMGVFLGANGKLSGDKCGTEAPLPQVGIRCALSVVAGRISYILGLTGPCLAVDTACSSSLVATHQAASAIKLVECPDAAVAGVGMLTKTTSITYSAGGMLSVFG